MAKAKRMSMSDSLANAAGQGVTPLPRTFEPLPDVPQLAAVDIDAKVLTSVHLHPRVRDALRLLGASRRAGKNYNALVLEGIDHVLRKYAGVTVDEVKAGRDIAI